MRNLKILCCGGTADHLCLFNTSPSSLPPVGMVRSSCGLERKDFVFVAMHNESRSYELVERDTMAFQCTIPPEGYSSEAAIDLMKAIMRGLSANCVLSWGQVRRPGV